MERTVGLPVWRIHIILIRIRIQDVKKFVEDPDLGKNDLDPDPGKKGFSTSKSLKCDKNAHIPCFVCVDYLTISFL